MAERIKNLIKPLIYIAAGAFLVCFFVKKPEEISDYCSYIGYSITVDTLAFILYERVLWRYIPWNRPPLLKQEYNGVIKYNYNGVPGTKNIDVRIEQSWLQIKISTSTDINASSTVMGSIVQEQGKYILYYTYVTDPHASVQEENPIQYGTCRVVLQGNNSSIRGKYWTSSKTTGDIMWEERTENR